MAVRGGAWRWRDGGGGGYPQIVLFTERCARVAAPLHSCLGRSARRTHRVDWFLFVRQPYLRKYAGGGMSGRCSKMSRLRDERCRGDGEPGINVVAYLTDVAANWRGG